MAQPTMIWPAIAWPAKGATKLIKWGDKESIRVSLIFNGVRSRQVAKDLSPWRKERREACIWWIDHLQFDPTENWTAPYSNQVSPRPKSFFSSHTFGFSFPVLSSSWKVFFIDDIYTLWSFGFPPRPPHQLGGFSSIDPLFGFPSQSSHHRVGRFFTSNMTLWHLSASLRG